MSNTALQVYEKKDLERRFSECVDASSGYDMHVAFIDFNDFKEVNDTLGHEIGDFVIEKVCEILINNTRKGKDRIVRNGGDEFVMLLPKCNEDQALEIVNRVSDAVTADKDLTEKLGKPFTVSIGCTPYDPSRHKTWKEAISDADKLMYVAKRGGGPLYIVYSKNPQEIDVKKIAGDRNGTILGMDKRDKFKYIFNYISRRNRDVKRELLVKAMRVVWRGQGDLIVNSSESHIMGAVLENYREVEYEYNQRMSKLEAGKISVEEMNKEYEALERAEQEQEFKQMEDQEKLNKLDEQLEAAKEVDVYAKVKAKDPKSLQELKQLNKSKQEVLKDRLAEQKRQNMLKRAEWVLQAAKTAEQKAAKLKAEYETLMSDAFNPPEVSQHGRIILQDASTGKKKVIKG